MALKTTETLSIPPDREVRTKHLLHSILSSSYAGLIYTFLGIVFTNLTSVLVKKIDYISPGQLNLARNAGNIVWGIPIAIFSGVNILCPKKDRLLLIVCTFFIATTSYLNFLAYRLLPLAESVVILSTTPVMIVIGARLFLKEPCGIVIGCSLVLSLLGILISVKIPDLLLNRNGVRYTGEYLGGISSAIGSILLTTVFYLILRKVKHIHFSVVMIYTGILGVIESSCVIPIFSFFELPHCGWDPLLILLVVFCGFSGQSFLIMAIHSEVAAIVSIVRFSLTVVVGVLFHVIFFRDQPDVYNYCGAFIVMISVTVIGLKKFVQTLPDESTWKRKLKFLLL